MRNQVQREKSRCTKTGAAKHCPGQQKGQLFTQSPTMCHMTSASTVQPTGPNIKFCLILQ